MVAGFTVLLYLQIAIASYAAPSMTRDHLLPVVPAAVGQYENSPEIKQNPHPTFAPDPSLDHRYNFPGIAKCAFRAQYKDLKEEQISFTDLVNLSGYAGYDKRSGLWGGKSFRVEYRAEY